MQNINTVLVRLHDGTLHEHTAPAQHRGGAGGDLVSRAYYQSVARRRAVNAAVQERRRLALVGLYSGNDEGFNAWLGSLSFAEIVARHNSGSLRQPTLPDEREEV